MSWIKKVFFVALTLGVITGTLAIYIGFQHNPQGKFYDIETGIIDFGYSFIVFLSWFLSALLVIGVPSAAVAYLFRKKEQG